jgi:hypothetical protein
MGVTDSSVVVVENMAPADTMGIFLKITRERNFEVRGYAVRKMLLTNGSRGERVA